ncbi:MAG: hypothetical protein EOO50_14815 [Flavobacterium sp.]|uniref:hypothetical protein n=1 Tax=Flavobacterium sp. TaxID=239 RepID=UPI00121CC0F2|nr:hypothetical protein [Flavobacterium sp.]RZJ65180.1 MAG: hypothetical protein EOO50_14815 [Flavobacterium sp.]
MIWKRGLKSGILESFARKNPESIFFSGSASHDAHFQNPNLIADLIYLITETQPKQNRNKP